MNHNNPGPRSRGPPNGNQMGPGPRPGQDMRNGPPQPGMIPPSATTGAFSPGPQMSRAEKFEDEKKRIIETCFGKKEPDGSVSESYITHIRIQEDEDYPSIPAPLESPSSKKKTRVIMVAVRKSGRVRMHKGRENANGTFSIGKTWHLDDLSRIESYTNMIPQTPEEQHHKQNAAGTGFLVMIQKPYYWQAATAKEKDFFIFSLIKIYRKYTGGNLPELVGFSPQELDQLGGPAKASNPIQQDAAPSRVQPNGVPPTPGTTVKPPLQDPPKPRVRADALPLEAIPQRRPRPSQEREPPPQERPLHSAAPQEHRVLHSATSRDRSLHPASSNDRMRLPGSFPSTDSLPSQKSQPPLRARRSGSPTSQRTGAPSNSSRAPSTDSRQPPLQHFTSEDYANQPPPSGRSSSEQSRPNGLHPQQGRFGTPSTQRSESGDERPRTANREDGLPPSLAIRNMKQKPPNLSNDTRTTSENSSYTHTPRVLSSESHPDKNGRQSDRDYGALVDSQFEKNKVTGEPGFAKPPSQDASNDRPPVRKPPETETKAQTAPYPSDPPTSIPVPIDVPATPPPEPQTEPEVHRPGLGPMIKKKSNVDVANKFRKAATAFNAFKPRTDAGADSSSNEKGSSGDGITGVFQAPSVLRGVSQDDARPTTPTAKSVTRPSTPDVKKDIPQVQVTISPEEHTISPSKQSVKIAQDPSKLREVVVPPEGAKVTAAPLSKPPLPSQDECRRKRHSDHSAKYAKSLGIAPSLLEGRTFEIEAVLSDFGWAEESSKATFEDLETGIRKELARVEAGSWLGAVENNDDRTTAVSDIMDKVMAECEELDCLLTLYNVELGSLSEDVAYIEAQSQGLQVQTANQKLLHTELRSLLDTISISASQLKILKDASLSKSSGVRDIESILGQLYTAMLTIDPHLRQKDGRPISADQSSLHRKSSVGVAGTELSSMHAVREKKEGYRRESEDFIQRLKQYMGNQFSKYETETTDALEKVRSAKIANPTKLDDRLRERPKRDLWTFSPLLLFVREVEPAEWEDLIRMYETSAKRPYQEEFRDNVLAWKRNTRKPIGDESEVLFTAQEKEPESLVGRKLTVKRTKTVRADGSSRISAGDRPRDGKVTAYEAFAAALTEEARIIFIEQNSIVDLFHVSSFDTQDFIDATATDLAERQAGDLLNKKPLDPNRGMARKILAVMEEIFAFWSAEIQAMGDWAVKQDALNIVGVLFAIESQLAELDETNQEFIAQVLTKIHDRLATQFTRFIEEQIRGIEDTKVKIKKRKGVIAFMKTFPNFSLALENMLPPTRSLDHLPIRTMVDDAYTSVNKAMFESLKLIAKEAPSSTTSSTFTSTVSGGDHAVEDKEALNHHILLIENMNHYITSLTPNVNPVLQEWHFRAQAEMAEHLSFYLDSIIRRPLGKLLDFLESTETLLLNLPAGSSAISIAQRPSHSRSVFKKILSAYDGKEVRRGLEALRKRIEKHFGEGDHEGDPVRSRELVGKVLKECEGRYLGVLDRVGTCVREVYSGELEVGWGKEDVGSGLRR